MQGIFTIGEIDTAKQREIDAKEIENAALRAQLTPLMEGIATTSKQVEAENTRGVDDVWKGYGLGKATKLAKLLEGYGRDKRKFFDELRQYATDKGSSLDSIERLEQRWLDASSTETSKSLPHADLTGLAQIETDPIWAEPIEVSTASKLATLISLLGNGDWVDQGRKYLKEDQCPFCQQNLPHDFQYELNKLLEGNRKLKIERVDSLASSYALRLERLEQALSGVFDDAITRGTGLDLAWSKLHARMKENLTLMREKQTKPGEPVAIEAVVHSELTAALALLKEKVSDFNQRILDRTAERAKIKTMFFQVLCADRAEAYAIHASALAPLKERFNTESDEAAKIEKQIRTNDLLLQDLRRAQTGVDASVESINASLRDMGIGSFWIARREGDGHLYCLARPDDSDSSTHTLSEGEKTLISFLYFIELIKGSHDETGAVDVTKTVVVIDDPISSLSQNFVYDVATIIQHQLVKPPIGVAKVKQVIVLTHNLFFFHELVLQLAGNTLANASRKCQMLRVLKNEHSAVLPLDPTTFMNDYDALWQVLQDAKRGLVPVRVVPNTMRGILEQFFTFTTGMEDFDKALEKMTIVDRSQKFKALQRFLNRGSHKDGINGPPVDWSQYDVAYYLDKLRALLTACGNEDHYLRKMGEPEEESDAG